MAGSVLGTLFRVSTFGESHGPALGCVVDGCPPGLALAESDIQGDLEGLDRIFPRSYIEPQP